MSSNLPRWSHRPPLDGLRAIAALLVLVFHAGVEQVSGGYVGVDVFFVLSGFLITSILLRQLFGDGIRFLDFYARRARRLLPAACVVLVVTVVAFRLDPWNGPLDWLRVRPGAIAAALYGSNWWFLLDAQDYFAQDHEASPFLHYWSLSVEEQFYAVWPALLAGIGVAARRSLKLAFVVTLGICLAGLGLSVALHAGEPMASYFGTHGRAWQPMAGAAVALGIVAWPRQHRLGGVLAGLGLVGVVLASLEVVPSGGALPRGGLTVASMAALLVGLELAPASRTATVLSNGVLRRLGDWSYSIYLWHWPVVVILARSGRLEPGWFRVAVICAVTLALAAATFRFVETPTRSVSTAGRPARFVLGAGGIAAVVAGFVLLVLPVDDATRAQAVSAERTISEEASVDGDGPRVLLVGDSHAMALYPAFEQIALASDWSLSMRAAYSCPWLQLEWPGMAHRDFDCRFESSPADLVVLATGAVLKRGVLWQGDELRAGDPGWADAMGQGSALAVERWLGVADRVVVVEIIPRWAHGEGRCDEPVETCRIEGVAPMGTDVLEATWRDLAQDPRVSTLDLDQVLCPDGSCPVQVGGVSTRRDVHHLSADYAATLADAVADRLPELKSRR
ncbi:MAG: acyltransferase [Proteobacteria bacterium]|nr:acyltransferase [Pseudomonadota bacterium]MCP4921764.1 acyltransferase [Pseudomonadota bacterium]